MPRLSGAQTFSRRIDATQHHDDLMPAIATESIVELVALTAVGVFVAFVLFDRSPECAPKITRAVYDQQNPRSN